MPLDPLFLLFRPNDLDYGVQPVTFLNMSVVVPFLDKEKALQRAWRPVDSLGEALHSLRMSGTFYCRSELSAPWGIDLPPMQDTLMFHSVVAGNCWVDVPGTDTRLLRAGDFALVPHGRGHRLKSEPSAKAVKLFDLPREELGERYEFIRHGGGGEKTGLVCGAVHFEDPNALRLVKMLPKIIAMDASTPESEWIFGTVRLMAAEARQLRPGGDTVLKRISDILVIQAIRSWLDHDPKAKTGWLGALQDEQIGHAIALVHRNPIHPWSVASLAEQVGMSRSAFAARFMSMVGESPMQYVRNRRMQVAVTWLKETNRSIGEMAALLRYNSEAAFNRAFKKFMGVTPGTIRRNAGQLPTPWKKEEVESDLSLVITSVQSDSRSR